MDKTERADLERTAANIRYLVVQSIGSVGIGHIGGSLSLAETLAVLYFRQMNIDPSAPKDPARDKLVLSKGHAGPVLYATLAERGYFPREKLFTLNQGGTDLPSHCDKNRTTGIDMTTGSLGQGLSTAIGLALADRMDGRASKVFAIIGDGESDEGQVWEAAMAAAHFRLDNLIAFTDFNKMNIDGLTRDIMNLEDIETKWKSFNWDVQRTDGHDVERIDEAISKARNVNGKPSMIILDTVKGKGCSISEGKLSSHNMAINREQMEEALRELASRAGRIL